MTAVVKCYVLVPKLLDEVLYWRCAPIVAACWIFHASEDVCMTRGSRNVLNCIVQHVRFFHLDFVSAVKPIHLVRL